MKNPRTYYFLPALLICLALPTYAKEEKYHSEEEGEKYSFTVEQALGWKETKEALQDAQEEAEDAKIPPVKLYWGTQPFPELAEKAKPEVYNRRAVSVSPFGGSERHCREAFVKNLNAMIVDAGKRGYDAVVNIHFAHEDNPSADPMTFECAPGYKITDVPLMGSLAVTREEARRVAEAEKELAKKPPTPARAPAKDAVFLPLEPVLNSPEAKVILGSKIKVYWGLHNIPAYIDRYGPEDYNDDASVTELGRDGACKQAVLNILQSMVDDANEKNYSVIIKVTSYLNEQTTPNDTDYECKIGSTSAKAKLRGTFVTLKK